MLADRTLSGVSFSLLWGPLAFPFFVGCFGVVQFSNRADLERTEVERWKGKVVEDVIEER